jgi:8-oxo-dGTP pyrophosphatase MutT (NUDIX family)
MLTKWLGHGTSRLPPQPHTYIGVAGFVLDSQKRVLVVQERSGPAAATGIWKLPGGLVDRAENIAAAATREVREETGLDTDFVAMASIQEVHHGAASGLVRSGRSDLYCVCVLRPRDELQQLRACSSEIAACEWVPCDEVRHQSSRLCAHLPTPPRGIMMRLLISLPCPALCARSTCSC